MILKWKYDENIASYLYMKNNVKSLHDCLQWKKYFLFIFKILSSSQYKDEFKHCEALLSSIKYWIKMQFFIPNNYDFLFINCWLSTFSDCIGGKTISGAIETS